RAERLTPGGGDVRQVEDVGRGRVQVNPAGSVAGVDRQDTAGDAELRRDGLLLAVDADAQVGLLLLGQGGCRVQWGEQEAAAVEQLTAFQDFQKGPGGTGAAGSGPLGPVRVAHGTIPSPLKRDRDGGGSVPAVAPRSRHITESVEGGLLPFR